MLKICLRCGCENSSKYGTGRYCSKLCAFTKTEKQLEASRKKKSEETKKKMRKPKSYSPESKEAFREKARINNSGINNPNFGKKLKDKPESYLKFRAAVKERGQAWDEELRKKHSEKMLGTSNWMRHKKHSKETKEQIRNTKNEQLKAGLVNFGGHKISKPEKEIAKYFKENGIDFKPQFHINGLPYTYDFHILNTNIIIEFQGDYWHANPIKYKSGQIIKLQRAGKTLVDDIWARDLLKKESAKEFGYNVIQIWESDYKKNGINFIISKIKENV